MKKISFLLKLIVNLSLGFLFTVTAYGATLEVGPSGYPYTSIQTAITAATSGDTVLVHDGTYVENINFSGKAITVRSANGAAGTIIDGNASGSVVTFNSGEGSGSILDGFTIWNGYGNGWLEEGSIAVLLLRPSPIAGSREIRHTSAAGLVAATLLLRPSPIVLSAEIQHPSEAGFTAENHRPLLPTAPSAEMREPQREAALRAMLAAPRSSPTVPLQEIRRAMEAESMATLLLRTITNCTISGNTATLSGGGICLDNASASVTNSILWGNVPDQHYVTNSGRFSSLTYSDIDNELGETGNGNIRQDPLFVDPANGDFRLQPTSPCIDAGTSDGAPSLDRDGFPRYDYPPATNTGGGTYPYYDMGAYEKQGAVTPIEGTIGSVLTINGSDFGTKKGKVLINGIAAKIAKDGWEPEQITCAISKPPLPVDVAHPVSVVVDKVSHTLDGTFTVRGIVLDDLLVSSGTYPGSVTVTGKFFGTKKGKAYLYDSVNDKKKNLKITAWKMNPSTGVSELTFAVPKPSKSFPAGLYQLKISNKIGPAATSPEFTVLEPGP